MRRKIVNKANTCKYDVTQDYVYFIRREDNVGPVKIGTTANPCKRLSGIQTGNPYKLKIIKTIKGGKNLERTLHNKFEQFRMEGEWFIPNPVLFQLIDSFLEENAEVTVSFTNKKIKSIRKNIRENKKQQKLTNKI